MALRIPDPGPIDPSIGGTAAWLLLQGAEKADETVQATGAPGVVEGVGDLVDTARATRRWISDRHNIIRIGWFAGGFVMFAVGVVMIGWRPLKSTVIDPTTKLVKDVV